MSTSAIASSDKIQTALTNLGIPDGFIAYDTVPLLRQLVVALGNVTAGSGSVAWGSITGTLSNQVDLQSALDAKLSISALGTGVQTALGVNVGTAGAFVVNGGALGTPSGGTLTNCTGLPAAGVSAGTLSGLFTFNRLVTITQGTANEGILASTGYSLTGANAQNMIDLAGTWNTSGSPTAFKLRITNTASNASSLFFDFGTNAAALATLRIDGAMRLLKGYSATNYHIGDATGGISWSSGEIFFVRSGAAIASIVSSDGFSMDSQRNIGFSSGAPDVASNDAFFRRKSAATIQMGADAAGVTNQVFTAANRITSDGVGANLTIAAGNGRGAAGGTLILSTFDTAGAGVVGTLRSRMTFDTTGAVAFPVVTAVTTETVVSDTTWPVTINGVAYKILLKA